MNFLKIIINAGREWIRHDMKSYSAAFSYYAPLAIVPLLFLSIGVVSFIYGEEFTKQVVVNWGAVFGQDIIELFRVAIANLKTETESFQYPIIGTLFFLLATIIALNVLSAGFYRLWNIEYYGLKKWLSKSLRSLFFIFILQLYLIIVIGFEFFMAVTQIKGDKIISLIFLFTSTGIFFTMLYKLLPKSSPSWQGCVVGSSVSSIFFVLSKGSVNFYINGAHNPDIYGTAGLILVLLIWIFVLAAIIYYGASVAYEYDKMKNNLVNR